MKRIFKSFLFLLVSFPLYAQPDYVESLMTRRSLSYHDIMNNISYLVPDHYEKGNKDTLQAIMEYWEDQCGISEELVRYKIILSIDDGSFSESLYGDNILRMLQEYEQNTTVFDNKIVLWNRYYRGYGTDYIVRLNEFTIKLSRTLLETKELSAVERFFIRIYANDFDQSLFKMLESDELNGTKIKELYLQEKKSGYFHNDWMLGVWIPQGKLDILGVHPFLGYRLGVKKPKLTVDLAFGVKFANTPNTYQVYKDDIVWNTNYFLGWYVGMDTGYELFRLWNNSIDLIGGIAWDGFDSLNEKKEGCKDEKMSNNIHSINLNIGLGYKFHFKERGYNQRYIGIDVKYNFVNYKNPHGTNLGGNTYTVNLIIGNVISGGFHHIL